MDDPKLLIKQAEKKLQPSLFGMFFGGPAYEDACQLYQQAANQYKLRKAWSDAADCFMKAAALQAKTGDVNGQANLVVEAANVIKKESPIKSCEYFHKAVELYKSIGRISQSAKLLKGIAETQESEGNVHEAIETYKQAADLFDLDEFGKSNLSACMLKYADLISVHRNNFEEAISVYEKEGNRCLKNNLLCVGAKEYFFKALILFLASGDITATNSACVRYESLDNRFAGSREGKLIKKLIEASEERNGEEFSAAISDFNSVTRIDDWKVNFLLKGKNWIEPDAQVHDTAQVAHTDDGLPDMS